MLEHLRTACILLLIVSPVELRKVSSGGGGRGQSAARGNVGSPQGGNFNQGGGFNQGGNFNQGRPNNFQQPNSGFHGQPPHNVQQPHGGFNQPNNFNRGPQNFGGHVPPAKSSNTFAKALVGGAAGAIGGILIYEAGKAIIKSATEPYSYNGRTYHWDQNRNEDPNSVQCSMPLSQLQQDVAKAEAASTPAPAVANGTETTTAAAPGATTTPPLSQTIGNLQFQDGTRPKQIVWTCRKYAEVCCGADCCPAPVNNNQQANGGRSGGSSTLTGVLVAILLIILIGGCCCCLIAYKMCRSAFDCILPREQKYEDQYQQNGDYSQQQQQYPMQQYPNQQPQYPPQQQQYPQQQPFAPHYPNNQYPQQGYPNTYPSQPTY